GKGINLRDREKLLPVFKQLGRIFKKYTRLPQLIYRGVVLPEAFGTILTDKLPYTENKESIFNLIDGLAYGLRSWTDSKKNAIYWADNKDFPNRDSVVFISDTTDVIFDCNAFFNVIDSTGIRIRDTERPFDRDEFITYKQKPRVSNITRVYDRRYGDYGIWEVIVR
ncbi:hypothetical protein EB001_12305, partial [bacterium]|nr:hypothetical protein [bacterium]